MQRSERLSTHPFTPIEFETDPEDDPDFLARVEQTLWGVLLSQRVEGCVLVRVDNWFDHLTPLAMAALFGDAESLRLLHAVGASLSPKSRQGRTPLSIVRYVGNTEVVDTLLELDAQE